MKNVAVSVLACVVALLFLVRWEPGYIQTASGDDAFSYTFHYLFTQGAIYGRDITTTAGPWSLLYFRHYYPPTFLIFLVGQVAIALTISIVLLTVARRMTAVLGAAFFLGSVALLSISSDARFLYIGLMTLLLMPDFRVRPATPLFICLLGFAAVASLIKSTFLSVGAVIVIITLLSETLWARRIPVATLAFFLLLLLFNALAGQSPSDFLAFLAATFSISSGYDERFAELGSPWALAAFLLLAVPLGLSIAVIELRRSIAQGALLVLGYGAIFFLLFKTGFMRQDGEHVIRAFCTLLPFAVSYIAVRTTLLSPRRANGAPRATWAGLPSPWITVPALVAMLVVAGGLAILYPTLRAGKLEQLARQISALIDIASSGQDRFRARHDAASEKIRAEYPLPPLTGPVSVFSVVQTPVIAHGLSFAPLPTSLPYLATTPRTETANAEFLSGPRAPAHVLLTHDYTMGPSGIALISHYIPRTTTAAYLVLGRHPFRQIDSRPIGDRKGVWNDPIEVPAAGQGAIAASIRYKPTALTRLLAFLYQPPPVYLVLRSGSRAVFRLRLSRGLAEQGLVISPAINSRAAFAALSLSGDAHPHPTTSLQLEMGEPGSWLFAPHLVHRYFEPDIEVAFHRLAIPPASPPADASLAALSKLLALSRNAPGGMLIDLPDGQPAFNFSQDSPRRFDLPPEATRVRLSLGVVTADLPVRFRAFIAEEGDTPIEIWSQRIDQPGPQDAEFDAREYAGRTGRTLVLAATPEKMIPADQNFAYLSGIELTQQP